MDSVSRYLRSEILKMSSRAQTAHLASALSVVECLVAASRYLTLDPAKHASPERDRLILSKGHAVSALYALLAHEGFFPKQWLETFNEDGGRLPEQPSPRCVPGIELATGSLGHGLSVGLGMALAARIQRRSSRVVVVLSDGECQEGSVWEAAMMASQHELPGLTAIVDHNKWQATGRTNQFVSLEPLAPKWEAFGWRTLEVDGHSLQELHQALESTRDQRPTAIVAHTVKGKGVSFMEDDNNWHYRSPNADELARALVELEQA